MKDVTLKSNYSRNNFADALRSNSAALLNDLVIHCYQCYESWFIDSLRSPSDMVSVLTSLSNHRFTTLVISDTTVTIEVKVNKKMAIASEYVSSIQQVLIPCWIVELWWSVGKLILNMGIRSFFTFVSRFRTLSIITMNS